MFYQSARLRLQAAPAQTWMFMIANMNIWLITAAVDYAQIRNGFVLLVSLMQRLD